MTDSRCSRCRNPHLSPFTLTRTLTLTFTLTLTLTFTLTLTLKVLSLPLDHGQAVQLREVAQEQRRVLLDALWDSEEALAHASVKKVHC